MQLADAFERVMVLNLPYKNDRRQRLSRHLMELELADPSKIVWQRALAGDWSPPPAWFKAGNGAWGCLQSHLRVVHDALMDGIESYCVLEDDVVFKANAGEALGRTMRALPGDWGQLYLGGQHLAEPKQRLEGGLWQPHNINRTHAFALHRRAFVRFQQHISHAPDYIARGAWHIDHQLGLAHERADWLVCAPDWWIAGQEEGASNISGRNNPRMWWFRAGLAQGLPFVVVPTRVNRALKARIERWLHGGNNLKPDTFEDIGLDRCVNASGELERWMRMISIEALDRGRLPALQHPVLGDRVLDGQPWQAGAFAVSEVPLEDWAAYPEHEEFPPFAVAAAAAAAAGGAGVGQGSRARGEAAGAPRQSTRRS